MISLLENSNRYPSGNSIATLQKPEKVFLNNTNMMYALSENTPNIGSIRETFVNNQMRVLHHLTQPKTADFEIDGKLIFEVGGT